MVVSDGFSKVFVMVVSALAVYAMADLSHLAHAHGKVAEIGHHTRSLCEDRAGPPIGPEHGQLPLDG